MHVCMKEGSGIPIPSLICRRGFGRSDAFRPEREAELDITVVWMRDIAGLVAQISQREPKTHLAC